MNYDEFEENEYITIVDESGIKQEYHIDAVFDMELHKYIMYSFNDHTLLSRIENLDGLEYFTEVTEEEVQNVIAAYHNAIKNQENQYKNQ